MNPDSDSNPSERLQIKVKRLRSGARIPFHASNRAAGADLYCAEGFTLQPGERKLVPTGLAVEIPRGFYGRIAPRSGLAIRHGIDTLAGVIDNDYRGELKVALINLGDRAVSFKDGERIAQLIIERATECDFTWSDELSVTERAEGGFGSTGEK
jgi:dUTP pyrophosphatase